MNETAPSAPKRVIGKPFVKGDSRSGRPPGTPNKTTRLLKEAYSEAFKNLQQHPELSLTAWAKRKPSEFYQLASKFIPRQFINSIKNAIDERTCQ